MNVNILKKIISKFSSSANAKYTMLKIKTLEYYDNKMLRKNKKALII